MFPLKPVRAFVSKIWKDSVWSKVIAGGIIFLAGIIGAKIANYSWSEIFTSILKALRYEVPIYFFLSLIALYFIVSLIIKMIRKRSDTFWNEPMGHYTFKDLYNTLIVDSWPVSTNAMAMSRQRPPDDSLMDLFLLYYSILTPGVDFYQNVGDGHYLYGSLAPKLAGYGLVDTYDKPDDHLPGKTNKAYRISDMGHRFHAKLDKLSLKDKIKEHRKKERKK